MSRGLVQGHGGSNERLQRRRFQFLAFVEVDGAPDVAFEAGIEEGGRVPQSGSSCEGHLHHLLVRLAGTRPGPGIAVLGAITYPGGQSVVAIDLYLYGDQGAATVARETPLWQAWLKERFPMPVEPSK